MVFTILIVHIGIIAQSQEHWVVNQEPKMAEMHILHRGEKKYFFMFSKTLNTNLWKVHIFGFSKNKLLQTLYPF